MVVVGYTGDTVQDDKRLIVLNVIPEDPPRESLSGRRRREGETVTHQVQAGSLGERHVWGGTSRTNLGE